MYHLQPNLRTEIPPPRPPLPWSPPPRPPCLGTAAAAAPAAPASAPQIQTRIFLYGSDSGKNSTRTENDRYRFPKKSCKVRNVQLARSENCTWIAQQNCTKICAICLAPFPDSGTKIARYLSGVFRVEWLLLSLSLVPSLFFGLLSLFPSLFFGLHQTIL